MEILLLSIAFGHGQGRDRISDETFPIGIKLLSNMEATDYDNRIVFNLMNSNSYRS